MNGAAPITARVLLREPIAALAALGPDDPAFAVHLTLALSALASRIDELDEQLRELREREP